MTTKAVNPFAVVTAYRQRVAELKAERAHVEHQPPTMKEASATIDRLVDSLANEHRRSYRVIAARLRFGQLPSALEINERQHAVGLFAMIDPDKLRKGLLAAVAEVDDDPGISPGDRRQALAAIDAKLLEIEHDEEAVIREAAMDGMIIARRADADPMAVLGD